MKLKSDEMNNSLVKASRIISYISKKVDGARQNEIARDLSINKTTLFRFLNTLEQIGYVMKKEGKYFLGLRLFELGMKVPFKKIVVDTVHDILNSLVEELNETVNFAVLHDNKVLYLDKIESKRSLQINTNIGDKISVHCTALGKSILSILPEDDFKKIIKEIDLSKKTKNTIDNKKDLIENIKLTRERGYSIDNEEFEEGLRCVAVPVKLEKIGFYGAISVSGPVSRFTVELIPKLAEKLKEYSFKIENEIDLKTK